MSNWSDSFYITLDSKRSLISDSDFRFYNLGHLPLMATKTDELSIACAVCSGHKKHLTEMLDLLPDSLQTSGGRKLLEQTITQIQEHLHKAHNVRLANYYYALYAFWGAVFGAVLGGALSWIIYGNLRASLLGACTVGGLLIGQLWGKNKDRKAYKNHYTI